MAALSGSQKSSWRLYVFCCPLSLSTVEYKELPEAQHATPFSELMGNVLDLGNYPLLPLVGSYQGKSNKKANNKQNVLKLDLILSPVKKIKT